MAIKVWTIALIQDGSGEVRPAFYYNHVRDSWGRDFQLGCAFFSEEECRQKNRELNLWGTEVVQGSAE